MFDKLNATAREFFNALREFESKTGVSVDDTITDVNEQIESLLDQAQTTETTKES